MQPRQDDQIQGDEILWRRLTSPDWIAINIDGSRRVSSAAFKGRPEERELSVHIASLTSVEIVFSTLPYCDALAELPASCPQQLGREVRRTPEPNDVSHASIILQTNYGNRKKDATQMAKNARLVDRP